MKWDGTELLSIFGFAQLLQISFCIGNLFGPGAVAGEELSVLKARQHEVLLANTIMRAFDSTVYQDSNFFLRVNTFPRTLYFKPRFHEVATILYLENLAGEHRGKQAKETSHNKTSSVFIVEVLPSRL